MAVYTNDLRLKEIATGDEAGTWGNSTNTNLQLIADAFGFGTEAITTNADTHTTTIADGSADAGRSIFLKYTGTLDSACTITIGPNTVSKLWLIENATSGSQNIIIKQGSGATVTIANGQTKAIYSDGAGSGGAMVDAFTDLAVPTLFAEGKVTIDPADGVADEDFALFVRNNEATAGRNFGLMIRAGSNASDESLTVRNLDNSSDFFTVHGDGTTTVNESGVAAADFRVESDGNTHMLFVDSGANCVNIGGSTDQGGLLNIEGSDADMLVLHRTADTGDQSILFKDHGDHNATITGKNGGGLEFRTNGNSTVSIAMDSAGHVTMPNQSAFLVKLDGDQNNIPAGGASNTLVQFDSVIFDANSDFDTSNNRFTAPVTGKYLLTYMLRVQNIDDGINSWSVVMATSNRNISAYYGPTAFDQDANYWTFNYSMVHDMDANDLATVTVYQDGGATQTDISQYSYFSGHLVA